MEKFTYRQGFITQEVDISKEMIIYKGKNIPGNSINGFGISLLNLGRVVIGQALGGVIGSLIAQRGFSSDEPLNKDIALMPEAYGQTIITYNSDGQKQKVVRIPINTKEEICKKLINSLIKNFPNKFLGFGNQPTVEKALNISQKGAYIVIAIIILAVLGYMLIPFIQSRAF